jgi:preprotein translocase subunit SecD
MFWRDTGSFMSVRLTREAGSRLLEATTRNKGRTLIITWDERTIVAAPIQSPFGESFQFNAPGSREEGHVLLNALRHGRLPVAIRSFEYRDARSNG